MWLLIKVASVIGWPMVMVRFRLGVLRGFI
jgi:hypothetical protein